MKNGARRRMSLRTIEADETVRELDAER